MMDQYKQEITFIVEAMKTAYETCMGHVSSQGQEKALFDVVTETDLAIERYLIKSIKSQFPNDHILSEEYHGTTKIKERTWTIDPIDGTFNFSTQSPLYGVQCALIEHNEIVVAAIYLPILGETYTAIKQQGAYKNGTLIKVNQDVKLDQAIVSIGDYSHTKFEQATLQHQVVGKLYKKVGRIRMYGAACIDFSFVAAGKNAAAIVLTDNMWDIAPGILICKEAGAVITNPKGTLYQLGDDGVIVLANAAILEIIKQSFLK